MHLRLRAFDALDGNAVLRWVTSDDEAADWASLPARPASSDIFRRWHAEDGVRPFILEADGRAAAYGEIWEDPDEDEAELARLIVDPALRGRGVGRRLAQALLDEARRLGWVNVWLRVVPDNAPALRTYAAAGFARATPDEEAAFNVGQPVALVWLRASPPPG
ncbi:MAG TPA: GNAT family N-acetyltransferase [Candidatus Limnocylindrales bacterium]|nr:GNAT family N-acetyltransferase [Candidatus Limnocylindrales bacterium]